jgi:hypothetical protein
MKFGIVFRMKFRNCTKSGKANAEIFSELAWNNFRIRVVVSDLNSEFRIFFRGHSEYSDNSEFFSKVNSEYSEFFSEVIRSIRTIPNFFPSSFGVFGQFRTDFRIICGNNMEIHQNPLFFHENIFFLIRKSPNTPNSIFRANIRNLLLRVLFSLKKQYWYYF